MFVSVVFVSFWSGITAPYFYSLSRTKRLFKLINFESFRYGAVIPDNPASDIDNQCPIHSRESVNMEVSKNFSHFFFLSVLRV